MNSTKAAQALHKSLTTSGVVVLEAAGRLMEQVAREQVGSRASADLLFDVRAALAKISDALDDFEQLVKVPEREE